MFSRSIAIAVLIGMNFIALFDYGTFQDNSSLSAMTTGAIPTRIFATLSNQIITGTLPAIDLAILPPEPITVISGGTTVYTLTIRNQSSTQATDVVLTDEFAKGVTPVSTQPAQPWCDRHERSTSCTIGDVRPTDTTSITLDLSVGGTQTHVTNTQLAGVTLDLSTPSCAIDLSQSSVTCRLPKLSASADAQIRIIANLDTSITGTLFSTATVTADEIDPNPSDNHATIMMTVDATTPASIVPVRPPPTSLFKPMVRQPLSLVSHLLIPTQLLANEPTGQLDSVTGASIIALLKKIATQAGVTVVIASHDPNVHEAANQLFELKDGKLVK